MADLETQIQKLSVAIAGLESQRKSLGNAVVDPAIAALREQLKQLESARGGSGGDGRTQAGNNCIRRRLGIHCAF